MEQYAKYLRKSRFDRDYAELSVEETLKRHGELLDRLAKDKGYQVVKTYYEVVSGESIAARPEIQRLLEEVNAGLYAGVLVVDVERLARGNGADQAYISQVFQFSGTKIITPTKVYDPANEFDEEYFEFGLFMSRREYKTINRRLVRGRDSSAREGKYISSIAPYGYQRVKLEKEKGYTLAPEASEAEVVRLIFRRFLSGEGTRRIATALNQRGVPTRHGGPWISTTISQILQNPVYLGKIRRGWARQLKRVENGVVKKRVQRQTDPAAYQLYNGLHPALVSAEDFDRAQALRQEKRGEARVKKDFQLQNAFAGLLFCARCGRRVGRTALSAQQGGGARLRCVGGARCGCVSADYEAVEEAILSALRSWLSGYRVKVEAADFTEEADELQARLTHLAQEEARLTTQLDNACDLLEQGIYTPEEFQRRREKLRTQLDALQAQQSAAQQAQRQMTQAQEGQSTLIPQTENLLTSYEALTVAERNALLKALLHRIEYDKTPSGEVAIDLYPRLPKG